MNKVHPLWSNLTDRNLTTHCRHIESILVDRIKWVCPVQRHKLITIGVVILNRNINYFTPYKKEINVFFRNTTEATVDIRLKISNGSQITPRCNTFPFPTYGMRRRHIIARDLMYHCNSMLHPVFIEIPPAFDYNIRIKISKKICVTGAAIEKFKHELRLVVRKMIVGLNWKEMNMQATKHFNRFCPIPIQVLI